MNRGKLLFAFVLSCAACASGCAPSTPVRARIPRVFSGASAQPNDAAVADSGVLEARAPSAMLYSPGLAQCVFGPNRERLFIAGGFRARIEGGTAQLATEALADPISTVTHTAHGYVFVSSIGAVLRSNEFIGALTRMPDLPGAVAPQVLSVSFGRAGVALGAPFGGLYLTDGRSAFAQVDALAGLEVEAVRFLDAQHGLVIGLDDELFVTTDGARWLPVNTRGRRYTDISISDDRRRWLLFERDTLRTHAMEPDGRIRVTRGPEPVDDDCRTTAGEVESLVRAIRARHAGLDAASVTGPPPTFRTVRLEHPVSRAPVELPGYTCALHRRDAWVWAKCALPPGGDRPLAVVAVAEAPAESGQLRTIAAVDPAATIHFLDDGESALWISDDRSTDGDSGAGGSTLVIAPRSATIRRWPLPHRGFEIRAATNGRALLASLREPSPSVAIVDVASGAIAEHRVSPSSESLVMSGTVAIDGTALVRFGASPSESREVFVILPGERPRTITLPAGAREAAMLDRSRGIAASGTGALWVTSNSASTWTALDVGVTGVRTLSDRELSFRRARCTATACDIAYVFPGPHLRVTWGVDRATDTLPLAIARQTEVRAPRSPALLPRLRCESARSAAAEPPPSSRAPATAERATLFGNGGTAVLSTWTERGRKMVELAWRGIDASAVYEAASAPTPMDAAWARGGWSSPHLAAIGPYAALLVLCPQRDLASTNARPPPPRCQYRLAPVAAAIRTADAPRTFYAADSGFATISDDGRVWTWGVTGIGDIRALDARGSRLASVSLSQALEPLWRGILRDGPLSRAVVSSPSSLTMLNTGDLNGRPTPFDRQHMAIEPPSVCRAPVAATARRMIVSESGARVTGAAFTDIIVSLAESSDGFCVERVDSAAFPSLTSSSTTTLLAHPDGSLDGTRAVEGGPREALHCTLASP